MAYKDCPLDFDLVDSITYALIFVGYMFKNIKKRGQKYMYSAVKTGDACLSAALVQVDNS